MKRFFVLAITMRIMDIAIEREKIHIFFNWLELHINLKSRFSNYLSIYHEYTIECRWAFKLLEILKFPMLLPIAFSICLWYFQENASFIFIIIKATIFMKRYFVFLFLFYKFIYTPVQLLARENLILLAFVVLTIYHFLYILNN